MSAKVTEYVRDRKACYQWGRPRWNGPIWEPVVKRRSPKSRHHEEHPPVPGPGQAQQVFLKKFYRHGCPLKWEFIERLLQRWSGTLAGPYNA